MKKMSLFVASIVLLSFLTFSGTGVFAQNTELPDPGLLPDSPFYFLEIISEDIVSFFTFGDIKKAERHAKLAAERLAEIQAVAEKEKPKLIEKTLARYEKQLENSIARAEKARDKGKNTEKVMEIVARVGQATSKHLQVLAEVGEKCPEQAKPAIENAMKVSLKGHTRAVIVLREKNALGNVPQQVSLPESVPQEVRERIQISVQEELVEKFIQGSESPRDLCVKSGGPPEACAKIPVDGFESFDALKAFFVEMGAPEEMWEVAKSKCEEVGAETPDKCFRVLLVSTSTVYASAEIKTFPQQERDPDRSRDPGEAGPSGDIRSHGEGQPEPPEGMRPEQGGITIEYQGAHIAPQSAYIGVLFTSINDDMQISRDLPVNYGALVMGIVPDTSAARAGLKRDDIILEFNNQRITEKDSLRQMLSRIGVETKVILKVLRAGETLIINVDLASRPSD